MEPTRPHRVSVSLEDVNFCEHHQDASPATATLAHMTFLRTVAASAALLWTLAACGSDATVTEAAVTTGDSAPESAPAGPALEGTFPTVTGGQLDLGALAGQDTVLWFWAPW